MNTTKIDLHIVFGNAKGVLKSSNFLNFEETEIVELQDDLCIGPIRDLDTSGGLDQRKNWLTQIFSEREFKIKMLDAVGGDLEKIRSVAERIDCYRNLYVWAGVNASERIAAARLMALLPETGVPVYMADFGGVAVPNIHGETAYPKSLMQTAPFQVEEVARHFRLLDAAGRKTWKNLWRTMLEQESLLRTAGPDGQIRHRELDYLDAFLLANVGSDYKDAAWAIGYTLVNTDFATGDSFLNWRLKYLAHSGVISYRGKLNEIRDYEVSL